MTDYWHTAKTYLSKRDPVLKTIIARYDGEILAPKGDAFFTLARAIAGQQISVKAADTVWGRVAEAVGRITPANMEKTTEDALRAAGLSGQKVAYMRSLSDYFRQNKKIIASWAAMSDKELLASLTSIKGIGTWTAEMFMIFHLARPDVFPIKDIGIQKAMFRHYHGNEKAALSELTNRAEHWRPYRSVATWYLWRSLDPVAVEY